MLCYQVRDREKKREREWRAAEVTPGPLLDYVSILPSLSLIIPLFDPILTYPDLLYLALTFHGTYTYCLACNLTCC